MPNVHANDIDLEYEIFGSPVDPTLLLIMGFSVQMTHWDERFCRQLADRRLQVIRFDNRDVGLSSKIEGGPMPDLGKALAGDVSSASYTLNDMADDAAALLDALGIGAAHVVGASMGGMIAQAMAIRHPDHVLSLCSIMSTTGASGIGQATPEAVSALLRPPASSREEAGELALASNRVLRSPNYAVDEAMVRARGEAAFERCHYPMGAARQLVGIMASPDRTDDLGAVSVPTLVIHGEDDPLVQVDGGVATAKAIPGSELILFPGMGHDFPVELWPAFIDAIVANAVRADA